MSRLNREDVISSLAETTSIERMSVRKVINSLFFLVKGELLRGNEVTLGDLLIIKPKLRKARNVRNPKTGETKMAPEKKVVFIKQRKMLKDIFKKAED